MTNILWYTVKLQSGHVNGCPCIPRMTFDCGVEKINLKVYAANFMHHAWPFSRFSRKFPATCAKNSSVIPVSSTQNSCKFGGFVAWEKLNIHAGHLKIRPFPTMVPSDKITGPWKNRLLGHIFLVKRSHQYDALPHSIVVIHQTLF